MSDLTDLAAFDALTTAQEDGVDVHILNPANGDPLNIVVRVVGKDSAQARRARRAAIKAQLAKRKVSADPAAEAERQGLELLAACVVDWTWGIKLDGKIPSCDRETIVAVFTRFPWMAEQVDAVVSDRAAFFGTSSTGPSPA